MYQKMSEDSNKKSFMEKSDNIKNMNENENKEDGKDICGGEGGSDSTKCKHHGVNSDSKLDNSNENNGSNKVCGDNKDSSATSKLKKKRTLILTCKEENLVLDSEETNAETENEQNCSKCGKEKTKNTMCCKCIKKVEKRVIRAALSTPKHKKADEDFEISAKKKLYETFVSESSSTEASDIHSSDSDEWGLDYIEECIEKIKPRKEKIKEKIKTKKTDVNAENKFDEDTESFWQHTDTSRIFSSFSEEEPDFQSASEKSICPEISDLLRGENIRDDVFTSSNVSSRNPVYNLNESDVDRSFESPEKIYNKSFAEKTEKAEESLSNNKMPNMIIYDSENLNVKEKKEGESEDDLTKAKDEKKNVEKFKEGKGVEKNEDKEIKEDIPKSEKDVGMDDLNLEEIIYIEENGNRKMLESESKQENENTDKITKSEGFSGIFTSLGVFFAGAQIDTTEKSHEHHKPPRDTQSSPELLDLIASESLVQKSDENNLNEKNISEEFFSSEKSASRVNESDENISTKQISISTIGVKKDPEEYMRNTNIYENVDGSFSDTTKSSKEISKKESTKSNEDLKADSHSTLSSERSGNFPVRKAESFSKYHSEKPKPSEVTSKKEEIKNEKADDESDLKSKSSEGNRTGFEKEKNKESKDLNKEVIDDQKNNEKSPLDQSTSEKDVSSIKSLKEDGSHISSEKISGNDDFLRSEREKSSTERIDKPNNGVKGTNNKEDGKNSIEKGTESPGENLKIDKEPKEKFTTEQNENLNNDLPIQNKISPKAPSTEGKPDENIENQFKQEIENLPEERQNTFKSKESIELQTTEKENEIIKTPTSDHQPTEDQTKLSKDIKNAEKKEESSETEKPSDVSSKEQESEKNEPEIEKIQHSQKLECQAELEKVSEIKTASKIISKKEENVSEKPKSDSLVVDETEEPTEKFVVTHYNLKSENKKVTQNKDQPLPDNLTRDQEELQRLENSMNNPIFIYFDTIRTDSATNSKKLRIKGKGRVAKLVEYFENMKNKKKDSKE